VPLGLLRIVHTSPPYPSKLHLTPLPVLPEEHSTTKGGKATDGSGDDRNQPDSENDDQASDAENDNSQLGRVSEYRVQVLMDTPHTGEGDEENITQVLGLFS